LQVWPDEWTSAGFHRLFMSWEFYLPPVLYGSTLIVVFVTHVRRREAWDERALWRVALATFGGILFLRATGRSDYYHLAPVLMPACLLGADLLSRGFAAALDRAGGFGTPARCEPLAFAAVGVMMGISLLGHDVPRMASAALSREGRVALEADDVWVSEASVLDDLLADLESRTAPGEPILVLPWYPVLYFLADRPNPTRFDWLFPGYLDGEAGERALIEEIDSSRVRVVVYSPAAIDGRAERSLAGFAPALDRYLRREFKAVKQFGPFLVWLRRAPEAVPGRAPGAALRGARTKRPELVGVG